MSMININELHKVNEERQKFRISVYDKVLKNVMRELNLLLKHHKVLIFVFMLYQILFTVFLYIM